MKLKWIVELKYSREYFWVNRQGIYHNLYLRSATRQRWIYRWILESWSDLNALPGRLLKGEFE